MYSRFRVGLIVLTVALSLESGFATKAMAKHTYTDDFSRVSSDWGTGAADLSTAEGVLRLKSSGHNCIDITNLQSVQDMDARISVALLSTTDEPHGTQKGGLIFWSDKAQNNKYYLLVTAGGAAAASRNLDHVWSHPIAWQSCSAINKGIDQWNELRVVTKGNHAVCYINGTKFGEFDGEPGDAPTRFGISSGPADDAKETDTNVYGFKNLSVSY